MNNGYCGKVLCLADMARDAVQNKNVTGGKTRALEKERNDLSGKDKVLVLEQESAIKNTAHKSKFRIGIAGRRSVGVRNGAELRTEIEMIGTTAKESAASDSITKRTFSSARRTKEKDRVNRKR